VYVQLASLIRNLVPRFVGFNVKSAASKDSEARQAKDDDLIYVDDESDSREESHEEASDDENDVDDDSLENSPSRTENSRPSVRETALQGDRLSKNKPGRQGAASPVRSQPTPQPAPRGRAASPARSTRSVKVSTGVGPSRPRELAPTPQKRPSKTATPSRTSKGTSPPPQTISTQVRTRTANVRDLFPSCTRFYLM